MGKNAGNILSKLNSYKVYLFIAVAIGIFVRLYGLDIQSFWYDELFSVIGSSLDISKMIEILVKDVHPPLYYIFLHYWMNIFGNSETIVRLLGAIAGILTIFIGYNLSKRLFNKYITASFTIFSSLSVSSILFSQEARMYSFVLLFSTILTLLWIDLLQDESNKPSISKFAVYGITSIFISYLHYFGALLVFFQLAYLLLFKKYRLSVLILSSIIVVLFLPWLIFHFNTMDMRFTSNIAYWNEKPGIKSFIDTLDFAFNKKLILFLLLPFFINFKIFLLELKTAIQNKKVNSMILSLPYLIICPILIVFAISQFYPVFYPRYFIILLPAGYLLISILISYNPAFKEIRNTIYIFIFSIISLVLFLFVPGNNTWSSNAATFYHPYKQQWRESTEFVMDNHKEDSIILIDRAPIIYTYYFKRYIKLRKSQGLMHMRLYDYEIPREEIRAIKEKHSSLFIFTTFADAPVRMETMLKEESIKYEKKDFLSLYVYYCVFR